jgi:hypothetical protein
MPPSYPTQFGTGEWSADGLTWSTLPGDNTIWIRKNILFLVFESRQSDQRLFGIQTFKILQSPIDSALLNLNPVNCLWKGQQQYEHEDATGNRRRLKSFVTDGDFLLTSTHFYDISSGEFQFQANECLVTATYTVCHKKSPPFCACTIYDQQIK